ncbi:VWA domain-containing protein [Ferrovum sp.]|uniref:vWA domain-containing protein n=1 Tax=Ferrovum sp. TaxID=2609467 RepID=UPI002624E556|nr:VWA domain-containing protein [Ferrovum sp.]
MKAALGGVHPGVSDLGSAIEAILSGEDVGEGNHIAKVKTGPMENEMKIVRLNGGDLPDLQAKAAANRLAARLEQLLEAKTNRRDVYGEEGRLCGRRLVNAVAGDQQVFRRVTGEKDGLDVAVSLLIDCSGSMIGDEMELARAAGYAVAEAFSKFESQGVALEVKGFNDHIYAVKEFHESFPSRSKTFSRLNASGGTEFQPTIIQSVKTLVIRREARKIVLFITDGDLGTEPSILVNTLKTQGIEVRGVLVGNEDESFFEEAEIKHFGCANDTAAIPAAVFKAMEKDLF